MEPLTLITTFVGPVGLDRLVDALRSGSQTDGLVTEFLTTLAASEDRLHLRLAGIENRLDQIIAQPYSEPLGLGVRLLADAANIGPAHRNGEIHRARQLFLKAATATTLPLEIAVAERYALICALALDEHAGYARTAYDKLRHAAFTAILQAADTVRRSNEFARERVGPSPLRRDRESTRDRAAREGQEALVAVERAKIRAAASETLELAVSAFREANAFDVYFGHPVPPAITRLTEVPAADRIPGMRRSAMLWLVTPAQDPSVVAVGDLAVAWNDVTRVLTTQERRMRIERHGGPFPGFDRWFDERWPRTMPVPAAYLLVDATVRALREVPLKVEARLQTNGREIPIPPNEPDAVARRGTARVHLATGEQSKHLRAAFRPLQRNPWGRRQRPQPNPLGVHLVIHGAFVIRSPTPTDAQ